MAWIESHQELGHHPKLKKLCRVLSINQPQAVGHLQYLWWWAVDYCDDGDLTRFDALDIAIASMWDGDPDEFIQALIRCGFIDRALDSLYIHDWATYIGKLLDRRRKDADRKRESRGHPTDVPRTSNATPEDGAQTAHVTLPYPTVPNQTEQNLEEKPPLIPPVGEKKPTPKRKAQVPESWQPDDKGRAFAIEHGVPDTEIDTEVQKFRDHHTGRGTLFADFAAAWRTWSRNYLSMRRSNITPMNRAGPGTGPYGRMTTADFVDAVREAEERELRLAQGGQP